jgi:hypothetical protein
MYFVQFSESERRESDGEKKIIIVARNSKEKRARFECSRIGCIVVPYHTSRMDETPPHFESLQTKITASFLLDYYVILI